MLKFYSIVFLIFFTLLGISLPQQGVKLALISNGNTFYLPAYERAGQTYFSLIHFAEALSLTYSQTENGKIEVTINNTIFCSSFRNPFITLRNKLTDQTKILQLPTSTYFSNNNLYVPLNYIIPILEEADNFHIDLPEPNKIIVSIEKITRTRDSGTSSDQISLTGFTLDQKANGTLVRIKSRKPVATYNSSFKDGILNIVFRDVNLDESKFNTEHESRLIKKIQARNIGKDCEIRFVLGQEFTSSEVLNADNSNDILITLHNKVFSNNADKISKSDRWNFDVVVIDAGHGGKDAGAIGINKVKEKDINLQIALKLGKLIEKEMPDLKVVYTRKNDTFVELYKRGKIANENNGKLFISIHCNSTLKKKSDASGFEVYLLRPGKTQDAIEIAEMENAVIQYETDPKRYQKLTDENFILVSMAHSSYLKYSEKFAELLHNQIGDESKIFSRGVKQAGFYVLVGASMPSVLIESGFLSNKSDAAYLNSSSGQNEIASAIFKAVKAYKIYYEKELEEKN